MKKLKEVVFNLESGEILTVGVRQRVVAVLFDGSGRPLCGNTDTANRYGQLIADSINKAIALKD